jgi:hypothetical protein
MAAGRILFGMGLMAALVAAAFLRAESQPVVSATTTVAPPMPKSGNSAVILSEIGGAFDLVLDPGNRSELVVSSLGDPSQVFRIELEAASRSQMELIPIIPAEPWARPTTGPTRKELYDTTGKHLPKSHSQSPFAGASRWSSPGHANLESCERRTTTGSGHTYSPACAAQNRRFFLHVSNTALEDPAGYIPIEGVLAGEGRYTQVYVDLQTGDIPLAPGLVREVIRLLDSEIMPRGHELLGSLADVDGDGKLTVLITPWLGKLGGGRTSINGCVRASDFQPGVEAPFGNSADVLYLNSNLEPGAALEALLAHEYTHAVCFSQRLARADGGLPIEDDWLNEAIAHVAENLLATGWSNLEDRISTFLSATGNSPLVVADYYRAGLWRDPGCRGATYLFLRYCVDRFGPQLLGKLIRSPQTGIRNLEQATGVPFADLFRHWTIALARDRIESVPLNSTLGNRQLTGVQRLPWNLDEGPYSVELHGTACTLIQLDSATGGVRRISVRCAPGARPQVTVFRE